MPTLVKNAHVYSRLLFTKKKTSTRKVGWGQTPWAPLWLRPSNDGLEVACVAGVRRGERGELILIAKCEESTKSDPNDRASRSNLTSPLSPHCTPATQASPEGVRYKESSLRADVS